jgi:predicted methyltransferase
MKTGLIGAVSAVLLFAAACGEGTSPEVTSAAGEVEAAAAGSLQWAVAGDWRIAEEKSRDAWRHPVETLEFFGVKSSDTVVEIWPGGGWYTAILGPYLKSGAGKLYAAHMDPASSDYARQNVEAFRAAFIDNPDTYGEIALTVASRDAAGLAPDASADVVLTFRNVHNWMAGGYAPKMFADAYRALKPGGVLGVVEHRLPSRVDQDLTASTGYVHEAYVKQLAEAAGFVFEEASEVNANPADTADHPLGVWMLPPNLRAPAADSELAAAYSMDAYTAIGESDRMTLRFRKPVAEAAPAAPEAPAPVEP